MCVHFKSFHQSAFILFLCHSTGMRHIQLLHKYGLNQDCQDPRAHPTLQLFSSTNEYYTLIILHPVFFHPETVGRQTSIDIQCESHRATEGVLATVCRDSQTVVHVQCIYTQKYKIFQPLLTWFLSVKIHFPSSVLRNWICCYFAWVSAGINSDRQHR